MHAGNLYVARNQSSDEMFDRRLRDLVQSHLAWTKPASREHMIKALLREAKLLKASIKASGAKA